jgi:hypothetical protein
MKILVCISHVPDTTAKIAVYSDNKEFVSSGVTSLLTLTMKSHWHVLSSWLNPLKAP